MTAISKVVKLHNAALVRQEKQIGGVMDGQITHGRALRALTDAFTRVSQMFAEERKLP